MNILQLTTFPPLPDHVQDGRSTNETSPEFEQQGPPNDHIPLQELSLNVLRNDTANLQWQG